MSSHSPTPHVRCDPGLCGRSDLLFATDAIVRLQRLCNGIIHALNDAANAPLIAAAAYATRSVEAAACAGDEIGRDGRC